jgi:hypothetical protein
VGLQEVRRSVQVLFFASAFGVAAIVFAGPAAAAPQTNSPRVSLANGTADVGGFQLHAPVPPSDLPTLVLTDFTMSAHEIGK